MSIHTQPDEPRLGFWSYLALLFTFILSGVALDSYITLDSCEYDSCRYLRFSGADAGLEQDGILGFSGTQAMHSLYSQSNPPATFLISAITNFLVLSAALILVSARRDFIFFPLTLTFLILPGKEFFIVAAITIYCSNQTDKQTTTQNLLKLGIVTTLLLIARPSYIPILVLSSHYWIITRHRGAIFTILYLAATSTLIGAGVNVLSPPDPDHAALQVESSIESISIIRNMTFGFDAQNIALRTTIYFAYLTILPLAEIYRLYTDITFGTNSPAQFYAIGAIVSFIFYLTRIGWHRLWKMCCIAAFTISSTYPFVHTRYLLPVILMLYYFSNSTEETSNSKP